MTNAVHLTDDLLIRSIDADLTSDLSIDERVYTERHLAACESCRLRRQEWAQSLDLVETAVASIAPPVPADSRVHLEAALGGSAAAEASLVEDGVSQPGLDVKQTAPQSAKAPWWHLAVAASVAFAVLSGLAIHPFKKADGGASVTQKTAEVSSDTDYLPLPYSSATLSPAEARVVHVEMPASALREAGIFVPVTEDEYVDADILLGLDGQPQGIRLAAGDSNVLN